MGYPTEVGVVWTIADRVAIRPEVNWTRSTTESTGTSTIFNGTGVTTTFVTTTSETTATGAGVSALLYLAKGEALRAYVAPRFAYSRATASSDRDLPIQIPVPLLTGSTTSTYTVSGSIGAQYSIARRFGVFGEVGLAYGRSTLSASPALSAAGEPTNRTVGIRSGVGVILFFGS
jgi:hypothetical protein